MSVNDIRGIMRALSAPETAEQVALYTLAEIALVNLERIADAQEMIAKSLACLADRIQRRKDKSVAKILNVDVKCIDLARHFLSDLATSDDADVDELAQRIQSTVEDFINVAFDIPAAPDESHLVYDKERRTIVDPRDPDHSRTGMFVLHNCARCDDGKKPCVAGNPRQCVYPHARND